MRKQVPGLPWQVRKTALEIDLALLRKNFRRLALRAQGAKVVALVKSDAYGHSAGPISRELDRLPDSSALYGFGVALVEEGLALRSCGVRRPILVMSGVQSYSPELHRRLLSARLTPVISSLPVLKAVGRVVRGSGRGIGIHLKLNTGMNRLGVDEQESGKCISLLRKTPEIRVQGILSHFSAGDRPGHSLTRHQISTFRSRLSRFRAAGISPGLCHLENSSGLAARLFPEGNLVRVGLHLYGLDDPELEPIARWTAEVYQVRELAAGASVGYGPRFRSRGKMRMAVLGVGYGDGYRRGLSNKAHVLLKGRRCPVIGAVSMDLTAVDVTSVPSLKAGDRAVLLGADGAQRITAGELAAHLGSISWELLTGISPRVPRIFLNG